MMREVDPAVSGLCEVGPAVTGCVRWTLLCQGCVRWVPRRRDWRDVGLKSKVGNQFMRSTPEGPAWLDARVNQYGFVGPYTLSRAGADMDTFLEWRKESNVGALTDATVLFIFCGNGMDENGVPLCKKSANREETSVQDRAFRQSWSARCEIDWDECSGGRDGTFVEGYLVRHTRRTSSLPSPLSPAPSFSLLLSS